MEVERKLRVKGRTFIWERGGRRGGRGSKKRGLERRKKETEKDMGPMWKDSRKSPISYMSVVHERHVLRGNGKLSLW